jgi:predicted Zn-dependent peptidase
MTTATALPSTLSLPVEKTTLPSGLRIVTTTIPLTYGVSINFLFGAGSRYESDRLAGASHLFEHLLFKGTTKRPTPREIAETVESVGGMLNAFTDREITGYWCRIALPHYRRGVEVIVDMIRNSLLRDEDIAKEKQVVFEEIRANRDSPPGRVTEMADALLWPDQPLGRDVAGTVESVAAISREEMVDYLHKQYIASNLVISVAGSVTHAEVVDQINDLMGDFTDGPPLPMYPFTDGLAGPKASVEYRKTEQAHLSINMQALSMFDRDRHALNLLSVVLGESMSSRLFEEVREKRSLAYDIHSGSSNYRDTGAFTIESGVDPKRAGDAVPVIMHELARIRDGVTEHEFEQARELSKGRLLLRMEDSRAIASSNGVQELLRGQVRSVEQMVAEIDSVQLEDITRVARRVIVPEKLVFAMVGPFKSAARFERALRI